MLVHTEMVGTFGSMPFRDRRGVKGYPTWDIGGELYPGEKSLDELAELLPAHQIDELGVLAQFDPPSGASAPEAAPLARRGATCAAGSRRAARCRSCAAS